MRAAAVERSSAVLGLAVILLASTFAGCIQDLERRTLDAGWNTQARLAEAPALQLEGAPAMLEASGTIDLPADANVTLTGVDANLTHGNRSIDLEPIRVQTAEGTQQYRDAEGSVDLDAGENLTVTLVPAADAPRRANPDHAWNASVEVRWRYEEDDRFDAGRLEVSHNVTPERLPGLGLGVVDRSQGQVHGLVFEAIDASDLPATTEVTAVHLAGGSAETLDRIDANLTRSDGTARVTFGEPLEIPTGTGYLVFRLGDPQGAATTGLVGGQEPVPGFAAPAALLAIAAALLLARRR